MQALLSRRFPSITIKDIAKKAGVSTATVSRVLNNIGNVSEEKTRLIQKIVEQENYQPNALARSLIQEKTKTIGIIIPDINNLYYPPVLRGMQDVCELNGDTVFLCNTDQDIEKEKWYVNSFLEKRVDGIAFMGTRPIDPEKNSHIIRLNEKLPVVMVSDALPDSDVYSVLSDEVAGAYEAVHYLIRLGHRNIAHITGYDSYTTYHYKQVGYEKALRESGIPICKENIVRNSPDTEGGEAGAAALFQRPERPTAIFAASDQIAIGVLKAAYLAKLRVPEDVSVVGYANIPIADHTIPGLTTVNQFPYETGRRSAGTLTKLINKEEVEEKQEMIVPKLLIRNSCGSP